MCQNDYPEHLLFMWIVLRIVLAHFLEDLSQSEKFSETKPLSQKRFKQVSYLLRISDTIKTLIMQNNFKALSDAIIKELVTCLTSFLPTPML